MYCETGTDSTVFHQAVNGLGPSAYLGAGPYLSSKLLLTEGGALGNIETRHNSWLNGLIGRSEQPSQSLHRNEADIVRLAG